MLRVLVISPHRDDAAFSCAITIRALQSSCVICVANYFTVSEYAPFRSGEIGTVSGIRLQEDKAFAQLAGCTLEDLDLVDAPQRLRIGVSEISTLRLLDSRDAGVRETISEHIGSLRPDLLLLPLAIGNHIDHRIAQAAAIDTGIERLAFYEDLPYSARASRDALRDRARGLDRILIPWVFSSADARDWKSRCASLYPSQIDRNTVEEIAKYSERYEQGERLWVTEAAAELFRTLHRA